MSAATSLSPPSPSRPQPAPPSAALAGVVHHLPSQQPTQTQQGGPHAAGMVAPHGNGAIHGFKQAGGGVLEDVERRYACSFCGKRFIRKHHVKQHERLHTGERPFVCRFCGKSFVQQNGLISHAKTCPANSSLATTWATSATPSSGGFSLDGGLVARLHAAFPNAGTVPPPPSSSPSSPSASFTQQ